MRRKKPEWKQPVPTLDLRKHCRDQDKVQTDIWMFWDWDSQHQFVWMKLAQIRLTQRESSDNKHLWVLDAYLGGHTDFEHDAVPSEESLASELRRIECFGQQPSENREFLRCQLAGGVDVEAKLGLDILDIRRHTLPRGMEQRLSTSGRQTGRTIEM